MVELQMQIRQNNDEMMDSVRELNSWEDEIKAKETFLVTGEKPKKNFPIRNSLIQKIKKDVNKQKEETTDKTKGKKIKGTDYEAWGNFDEVSDDQIFE